MGDARGQVEKQVMQMERFIISEAREKALEIEQKARSEAEAKKQQDIMNAKQRINDKYKKDLQEAETAVRVGEAKQKKALDDSVLQARVNETEKIEQTAEQQIKKIVSNRAEYAKLMQQLTVQAAFALEGPASVRCLASDKDCVDLNRAAQEAEALLRQEGREGNISLKWDPEPLADYQLGGVMLTLDNSSPAVKLENGGITCDNTLHSRLRTCIEEYAPVLRKQLFLNKPVREA